MNQTNLVVLHCSSDAKRGIVKTLITHLSIMVQSMGGTPVKLELTDVDSPDFQLNGFLVKSYQQERPLIIILVTPAVMLNDKVSGDGMTALMRLTDDAGPRIAPIYCLPVPNPELTPWAKLAWLPSNAHDEYKALTKCGNADEACSNAARNIQACLSKMLAEQSTPAVSKEIGGTQQQAVLDTSRQSTPDQTFTRPKSTGVLPVAGERPVAIEELKIPPLAVFVSESDRNRVEGALEPVLSTLTRTRNVRSYSPWSIKSGSNWKRQLILAKHAPYVVIILSSNAIADDDIYGLIENIPAGQKVLFVLLSPCMSQLLPLEDIDHKMLPVNRKGEVVTVQSIKGADSAWQQVSEALLAFFPTSLPDERTQPLTPAEIEMQTRFSAEDAAARSRAIPLTPLSAASAWDYWNK